nr:hypothetical protein [Desulfobulbaceae bacterium]
MKGVYKKYFVVFWVSIFLLWSGSHSTEAKELGGEFAVEDRPIEIVSYQSYAGLSELVSMICDDAIDRFQGFYGPTVVTVRPFASADDTAKDKVSKLGVTLADQMIAMVNNDTLVMANSDRKSSGESYEQNLSGVLQEIDGYLRVHISGRNVEGKRVSYVANIEMSEPIYRALHTYL